MGGGYEESVAALFQVELLLQEVGAERVVAAHHMGLAVGEEGFDGFGRGVDLLFHLEDASGEVGDESVGGVEVGVAVEEAEAEVLAEEAVAAALHQGGIGLIEVAHDPLGQRTGGGLLLR